MVRVNNYPDALLLTITNPIFSQFIPSLLYPDRHFVRNTRVGLRYVDEDHVVFKTVVPTLRICLYFHKLGYDWKISENFL